jgi:hypothetical protein
MLAVPMLRDIPLPLSFGFFQIYTATGPVCGESPNTYAVTCPSVDTFVAIAEVVRTQSTENAPEFAEKVFAEESMPIWKFTAPAGT